MKKLFLFLLLGIFLIGIVSAAWEWDNIKKVKDDSVIVINALGLGKDIAKLQLNTPHVYNVMRGKDRLVAEFTIENFDDYDNVFNNMEFYDLKNKNKKIDREFVYKYKVITGIREVPYYREECSTVKNITTCESILDKTFYEEIYEWKEFSEEQLKNFPKGKTTIGIFTDVYANERIEWIPTLYGVKISEWAEWVEGLSVDLRHYWQMNETTGTNVVDIRGGELGNQANGTINSETYVLFNQGKVGNALNFTESQRFGAVKLANESEFDLLLNASTNITISVWINQKTMAQGTGIFCNGQNPIGTAAFFCLEGRDANDIEFYMLGDSGELGVYTTSNLVTANAWHHIVFVLDTKHNSTNGLPASNVKIYINNVSQSLTTMANNFVGGISADSNDWAWIGVGFLNSSSSYYWNGSIDELGIWNRTLSDLEVSNLYNNGDGITYTPTITAMSIEVNLNTPANNTITTSNSYFFSSDYTIKNGNLTNATLYLWYFNGTLIGENFSVVDTAINKSNRSFSLPFGDNILWNYQVCGINSTSTLCNYALTNRSISRIKFQTDSVDFNASSFETSRESFRINITLSSDLVLNEAKMYYNGTSYTSSTSCSGQECSVTNTLNIPINEASLLEHNNTFYWNFTINSDTSLSSTYGQNTTKITFAFCNTTLTNEYINISFKDESNLSRLAASIPSSNWVYYLGSGSVNKTLSFINNSENLDYVFCLSNERTLTTHVNLQYKAENYPQRIYSESLSLSNITTNKTLYLLGSADGIYVSFQVVDASQTPIQGVSVNATRLIGIETITVGQGTTGADGIVTFWLNPNSLHTLTFSKTGYTTYITSIYPTQTSYTISLGVGVTAITVRDYFRGISYKIEPQISYLLNDTTYEFNFTITSDYWTITEFGFYLLNKTGNEVYNSSILTTNGGTARATFNTGSLTYISMDYWFVVNNTYINMSRYGWGVFSESESKWSIKVFFDDFLSFTDSGLFGLNRNSLGILTFIFIILSVGLFSYKFGIVQPIFISGFIFVLVLFFDFVLGIMINNVGGIPHFATFLTGIIFLVFGMREVFR